MGEHLFIAQRFNEAAGYLDRGERREHLPDQLICDVAHDYATIKLDDSAKLTTGQMVELLRRIEDFDGFEAMIVITDQRNRPDPRDRAAIIEEYLRSLNPEWKDGWFEYDFEESRLRAGGKGLKRLSGLQSVLAGLQPRHLDLSGSEVSNLRKEAGYGIESLDIRGCNIDSQSSLQKFIHLRELTICPGQRDSKNRLLKKINLKRATLIERELDPEPTEAGR